MITWYLWDWHFFGKQITRFLVSIRKLCIVYLEKYVVPIGHGFSFFWSWKSHGQYFLEKSGHPELYCATQTAYDKSRVHSQITSVSQRDKQRLSLLSVCWCVSCVGSSADTSLLGMSFFNHFLSICPSRNSVFLLCSCYHLLLDIIARYYIYCCYQISLKLPNFCHSWTSVQNVFLTHQHSCLTPPAP